MRVPDSGKTGTPRAERVEATTLTREAEDALKRLPRPFSKSSSTQRVVPRGVCEGVTDVVDVDVRVDVEELVWVLEPVPVGVELAVPVWEELGVPVWELEAVLV